MDQEKQEEAKRKEDLRRLARHLLVAVIVFSAILGGLFSYTRTWPPMVAVDSGSMQHGNDASSIGVIDTGDLVLVQAISSRADITTYLEGRATGYSTYGDSGDVIIFSDPSEPRSVPYIHRAMAYVRWNDSVSGYDIPDLSRLSTSEWTAWDSFGSNTSQPYGIRGFTLHKAGWRHDLNITFDLTRIVVRVSDDGFLTMGDNNAYTTLTKFDLWVVPLFEILGRARGEVPWFGLLKLTFFPEPGGCCSGWGSTDPERGAPANSWTALDVSLIIIFGAPIALAAVDIYLSRHPDLRRRLQSRWERLWHRGKREEPPEPPQEEKPE